jgi:hypothetical protein
MGFFLYPSFQCILFTKETAKIAMTSGDLETQVGEGQLRCFKIVLGHDKNILRKLGKIPKIGSNLLQLDKVAPNVGKFTCCSRIVRLPRLFHLWKLLLEFTDEWKDADAVSDHRNWISLGDALLAG